jgi:hypothetical protein
LDRQGQGCGVSIRQLRINQKRFNLANPVVLRVTNSTQATSGRGIRGRQCIQEGESEATRDTIANHGGQVGSGILTPVSGNVVKRHFQRRSIGLAVDLRRRSLTIDRNVDDVGGRTNGREFPNVLDTHKGVGGAGTTDVGDFSTKEGLQSNSRLSSVKRGLSDVGGRVGDGEVRIDTSAQVRNVSHLLGSPKERKRYCVARPSKPGVILVLSLRN